MKLKEKVFAAVAILSLSASVQSANELSLLSDEFDDATTIGNWRRIYQVEGWGNNALERFDINTSQGGRMTMMPHTSSWYEEYRGELTFKEVTGDFVITTDVEPLNRAGTGAPRVQYSLAGIMVRTPRTMTSSAQWTPGGQNYVFLSLGAASDPGRYQFEVKTTLNSVSTLVISEGASRAAIQVARLGAHLIMLRRSQGGAWQVHRRYFRPDMPATLQAGLTVYTDWPSCDRVGFQNQNTRVLTNGAPLPGGGIVSGANPDLVAYFDYVRYQRPEIPANLATANFSNSSQVSDAQLLAFLGANANRPGGSTKATSFQSIEFNQTTLRAELKVETNRSYRVQAASNFPAGWMDITNFVADASPYVIERPATSGVPQQFFRIVSP